MSGLFQRQLGRAFELELQSLHSTSSTVTQILLTHPLRLYGYTIESTQGTAEVRLVDGPDYTNIKFTAGSFPANTGIRIFTPGYINFQTDLRVLLDAAGNLEFTLFYQSQL